jgi:hypothetical protein
LFAACSFDPRGFEATGGDDDPSPPDAEAPIEPLDVGLGSGADGSLDLEEPAVLNGYTAVLADVLVGGTRIEVEDGSIFAPGDVVMIHQAGGLDAARAPSGDQTAIELDSVGGGPGAYELSIVAAVDGAAIELTHPLARAYTAGTTQAIRVPQFTDVRVRGAAIVLPQAWDGRTGGVIAVLATGTIRLDGDVNATASGFAGGEGVIDPEDLVTCTALDGDPAAGGGAPKGAGLVTSSPAVSGWGNIANGGGGGSCHNAGGAGGGGAGLGGRGGGTYLENAPYGGRGGANVVLDPSVALAFGGGGGAGHDNADGRDGDSAGGAGGGVVWLRADAVEGDGAVRADGASALTSPGDGAGGGGAGGMIVIVATTTIDVRDVTARGGRGGNSDQAGSGGGGGGGAVHLDAPTMVSVAQVAPGGGGNRGNAGLAGTPGLVTP